MMAKRLVIVTGTGGVGKSTAAAALGVVAARRGLATIVAEVAARFDVARMLGAGSGDRMRESELEPGLHHVAIVLASVPDDPAVCSARWLDTRARSQRAQIDRLRRRLAGVRRIGLPLLFTADLGRGEIERLADRLQRSLS